MVKKDPIDRFLTKKSTKNPASHPWLSYYKRKKKSYEDVIKNFNNTK